MKAFRFLMLPLVAVLMVACNSAPDAQDAETGDAQAVAPAAGTELAVNAADSHIKFTGTKTISGSQASHSGYMPIQDGYLVFGENTITGGKFTFDVANMNIITEGDEELQAEGAMDKLRGHLLSGDFLEAETYPTASFEVTGVEALENNPNATHRITGNLTMRDVTKSISFDANVELMANGAHAVASFNIDRQEWGIDWAHPAQDAALLDEVNIAIDLVAGDAKHDHDHDHDHDHAGEEGEA